MNGRVFKKAVLVKKMMRYMSESVVNVVDVGWLLLGVLVEKYQESFATSTRQSETRRQGDRFC